jgi:uncharacterized protein
MRNLFCLLIMFFPALASAVPPPPVQLTADCEAPTYASDLLVCEDAGLRELDRALGLRIEEREESETGAGADEGDLDWFRRSRLCAFEPDQRECLVAAYCLRLAFFDRSDWINHVECSAPLPGYIPTSAISKAGFVSDKGKVESLLGRETGVWGFVDHQNLYGDDQAKLVLGDWWSGYSPDPAAWQFKLKANADDPAGQSFTVQVPNDMLRDDLLRLFAQDASAGRPTQVHLKGLISTFPAPANTVTLLGLSMELGSSWDIQPGPRPAP